MVESGCVKVGPEGAVSGLKDWVKVFFEVL